MSRHRTVAALAVLGGLLLAPQALPASATTPAASEGTSDAGMLKVVSRPPVGHAWLVGVVTDQAGHPLDGINVEAWPIDPEATKPTASNLTYASTRVGDQHGFFNLEVPIDAKYKIVISGPGTSDLFRTSAYNNGNPVKVTARKEQDLGTTEIAYTAAQPSTTTAKVTPGKVKVGGTAKVTVVVRSKNVEPVVGKVSAAVGGKKVVANLTARSSGKVTLTLPKLKKPGKYTVEVWFLGTSTVKKSTKKATLTVTKK